MKTESIYHVTLTATPHPAYHCAGCGMSIGVILRGEQGLPYLHVVTNGHVIAVDVGSLVPGVYCECGAFTPWEPGKDLLNRILARRRRTCAE